MKYGLLATTLSLGVISALSLVAASMSARAQQSSPSAAERAPPSSANYKGVNRLLPTEDLATGRRRFEAGAHTAWHIHPAGQLIHVEDGVGVVQRRGEPVKMLRKGDTDFTPAGVPHWHGAAPDTHSVMAMVHFGGIGPWLEPVTNADYAERTKHLAKGSAASSASATGSGSTAGGHSSAEASSGRSATSAPGSTAASDGPNYFGVSSTLPSDDMNAARGRFEAGAYTNWHMHPRGQVILAEEGPVFIQRRGEPLKVLQKGESDFTPPGVEHWHGAGPDSHAQKVVVGYGLPTKWLEPVSDAEYAQTRGKTAR